jgi:hypothetical protein
MATLSNNFLQGVMNKDLDERLIPEGGFVDALNVAIDTSDSGNMGAVRNQMGNTLMTNISNITNINTITNARTIGATSSDKDNLIYWLVSANEFDGIFEYNTVSGTTVRVLQSNKATPTTPSKLNFNKEFIVTGINYVNGFLFWTDNFNPPRRINVSRVRADVNGNGGYNVDDPRIDDDINVILAPPLNGPKLRLDNTLDPNLNDQANNMEDRFIYFSYRYKYLDNQYSAMSPFTQVAFQPKDYVVDYNAGYNKAMLNRYNKAFITCFTGSQFVSEIQILMRDARNTNIFIVDTINKDDLNIADNVFREFSFSNNEIYTVLDPYQLTRLFDNVPLLAKAQDYVGNRIMYGNYTQFYDVFEPIRVGVTYKSFNNTVEGGPIQTFRSDRDYQIGIQYLDEYGRSTTALTSGNNTIYIPPTQSTKGNSLKVTVYNNPPSWATNYRFVIKQGKGSYYNIFPIYFYVKNEFRYFLIHESDKDKIPVGGYIIIKCTNEGPTFSNKKYKVLELKSQSANFINGAQAGLYFKIKVDNPYELSSAIPTNIYWNDSYGISDMTGTPPPGLIAINNPAPIPDYDLVMDSGIFSFRYAENPIYYGDDNPNALSLTLDPTPSPLFFSTDPNRYNFIGTYRLTVQVLPNNQFRWTSTIFYGTWYTSNINIGTPYWINIGPNGNTVQQNQSSGYGIWIVFNSQPSVGDVWKINLRGDKNKSYLTQNTFNDSPYCFLTLNHNQDETIYPGDIIEIKINETLNPNASNYVQTFYSNGTYENIEEWFIESGAYDDFQYTDANGVELNEQIVSFRRGNNYTTNTVGSYTFSSIYVGNTLPISTGVNFRPVYMILKGTNTSNDINRMSASIYVRHFDNTIIAETVPEESDADIYHETTRTLPIVNGQHHVVWSFGNIIYSTVPPFVGKTILTSTQMHNFVVGEKLYIDINSIYFLANVPYEVLAVIDPYNIIVDQTIPNAVYNNPGSASYDRDEVNQNGLNPACIVLNNPLSTINSDFNAWSYGNGLETYRIRDDWNAATLQYSPRASTTIDGYGQKVSKNAICYSGIYGENTSVNELNEFNLSKANFKYLDGEYGSIQKLYARDEDLLVFQEDKVSVVLYEKSILSDAAGGGQLSSVPEVLGNQLLLPYEYGISKNPESFASWGYDMFFTDLRRGAVLNMAGNEIAEISSSGMKDYFIEAMSNTGDTQKLGAYDPRNRVYTLSMIESRSILGCRLSISRNEWSFPKLGATNYLLFTIITDNNWTLSLVDQGFGTNWVTGFPTSGYGTTDIFADVAENTPNVVRTVGLLVTYCNQTVLFTLRQGRSKPQNLNIAVYHGTKK